jgi:hypothetical protein
MMVVVVMVVMVIMMVREMIATVSLVLVLICAGPLHFEDFLLIKRLAVRQS